MTLAPLGPQSERPEDSDRRVRGRAVGEGQAEGAALVLAHPEQFHVLDVEPGVGERARDRRPGSRPGPRPTASPRRAASGTPWRGTGSRSGSRPTARTRRRARPRSPDLDGVVERRRGGRTYASSAPSTASRLAPRMSPHIPNGELAIRVMSRKPPAARASASSPDLGGQPDERDGGELGQVADGRHDRVVPLGRQHDRAGADRLGQPDGARVDGWSVGRQDVDGVLEQQRVGVGHPAELGARHRVSADERHRWRAAGRAGGVDDGPLDRRHVGHERARPERRRDLGERRRHRARRHRQHDHVRLGDGVGGGGGRAGGPALDGERELGRVAVVRDDLDVGPAGAERERERSRR